ncbi:hypothetical protein J504_0742 [Acinetobacter baumannii 348935]|uniref:hypothetical protein n=1 Tax=Acinetobacter variabilis TaxID=70346 RepID=UPI00045137D2|nr:hypothetical protein [Acinetobacter variabilis]EXA67865.1 hypothetical protein J504_0742 [Acinetobacter baumannii 348935]
MEFVLILLMLAAAFYFIIVAPALRSQKSRYTSSCGRNNTSTSHQYIRETERPKACPLWGIEISRTQQRRLGKNDPSVIAAKLYRQQLGKFASFQQTRPMADADPNRSSSSATLPRFFQNMFPEEASSTTRRTSPHSSKRNSSFHYTLQNPLKSAPVQSRSTSSWPP